jgi:hypothetical protein
MKGIGQIFQAIGRPVPATPLRAFEIAFTLAFLLLHTWNLFYWRDWLTTDALLYLTPTEALRLGYPAPFPRLPVEWVPLFALVLYAAGAGILFNRWRRLALIITAAIAIYVQGVDYPSTSAQYKICIIVYVLLATAPGYFRDSRTGALRVSATPIWAIQAVVVIIYWAAGWTKAFGEGVWLKHPDTLKLVMQGFHRTDIAAWTLRYFPDWLWTAMQGGTLLFEIGAPVWFFCRVTRPFALLAGIGLHLGIALSMKNVWPFSLQMIAFYPLFLSPECLRQTWNHFRKLIGAQSLPERLPTEQGSAVE